jgi:hypothetical protein
MPKICGEVLLKCSREKAFQEIASIDFAEKMDLSFKSPPKNIVFQNERMLRTVTKIENVGDVDMERVYIPESYTIVSQRKPPMAPFVFFIGLQILCDHKDGALLKWIEEFEVDAQNKPRENGIWLGLEKHEQLQFQKVRDYFERS